MGVDVGTKRVGIALADPLRIFAQPDGAFSPRDAIERRERLSEADGIDRIIIGWPLTEDGAEGAAVAFVRSFEKRLRRSLADVEIIRWDERYSSVTAKQAIIQSGAKRKARRNRGRVDAAAAAVILQEYLDASQH